MQIYIFIFLFIQSTILIPISYIPFLCHSGSLWLFLYPEQFDISLGCLVGTLLIWKVIISYFFFLFRLLHFILFILIFFFLLNSFLGTHVPVELNIHVSCIVENREWFVLFLHFLLFCCSIAVVADCCLFIIGCCPFTSVYLWSLYAFMETFMYTNILYRDTTTLCTLAANCLFFLLGFFFFLFSRFIILELDNRSFKEHNRICVSAINRQLTRWNKLILFFVFLHIHQF